MGKKSQPSMPDMPDVDEMIRTQARVNRVDQTGPYGQTRFEENPDGTWQSYTGFSAALQPLFERQINMAGAAPTTFKSGGMGDALRARIDAKLGRGSESEYNAPDWGRVMPGNDAPSTPPIDTGAVMQAPVPDTPPVMDAPLDPFRGGGSNFEVPRKPQNLPQPMPTFDTRLQR